MAKIKDIIEFLRLNRRNEEANKTPVTPNYVILESLDTHKEYTVSKDDFENFDKYIRLVNVLNDYKANYIYILETNANKTFYIKNASSKFVDIITHQVNNAVTENSLKQYEIDFGSNFYFYDTSQNNVVISVTQLAEIKIFSDTIKYIPNEEPIKSFQNDDYAYNYDSHESISHSILKRIAVAASSRYTPSGIYSSDRMVKLTKSEENGKMFLIPGIKHDTLRGKYFLQYQFWKPRQDSEQKIKPFYAPIGDVAMTLEFNYIGAFLSFLNETIFSQPNFNYSSENNGKREEFKEQFKNIVIVPLENYTLRDTDKYYREIIEVFYYLHEDVASTINPNIIWKLINKAIENDGLTNFSINEEDLFIKLLETLLATEGREEKFLIRLNETISVKNTTTVLEYLYDRLNGENGVKFVNLINKAWRKTRFAKPDIEKNPEFASTDGPLMFPYESEKWLGLYFSNAKVSFENNSKKERLLNVAVTTDQYKKVTKITPKGDTYETREKIKEHFWYHPFYPVYLKNVEKQDSELKLDSIVPAFVLKANEDKQFWSNVITSAEYALDVATTLSGIGNITKFRYLTRVTQLAEVIEGTNAISKVAKAANILRYVKGAAGVVELTSGSINLMIKITGAKDTEFGESLSKVLFYLELITLAGELTTSMKMGLKKSAKEAIEESNGALRVKHPELFAELYRIAGLKKVYQHVDDFMKTRPKFHDLNLINQLWKEKIVTKLIFPTNLRKLYFKYLDEFPELKKGFNQAEFKTTIFNQGEKVKEVVEFSLSGKREKLLSAFGDPPNLPENTIDILSDYENFETFVKGAEDFGGIPRNYDSEIKYIFNFLKNHIDKGDEFIIETQNIFKTCGSCRREFVMLEDYLKLQGKKVKIIVMSDETIEGGRMLRDKLKIK